MFFCGVRATKKPSAAPFHQEDRSQPFLRPQADAVRDGFFEADAMTLEEPPDRPKPRLVPALIEQTALDFLQRQIGLAPHQLEQPLLMPLERRPALSLVRFRRDAAGLPPPLRPPDRRRDSDHELLRRSPCRRPTLNHVDHSNSQV